MDRKQVVQQMMPREWDRSAIGLAHEIAGLMSAVKDEGTNIDSGGSDGEANLWVMVDGVEYYLTIRKSNRQKFKESGSRYVCPTCSGGGEIAPDSDCPDCDGTGTCVPPERP